MLDPASNYFELFDLPVAFAVDTHALAQRYLEVQRAVHPDRYVNNTDQERRLSMQHATRLNEAYRVLKDPLARARYLLELRGVEMRDDQETVKDPEFLMEQMELREALDEVRSSKDPFADLAVLDGRIDARTRGITDELAGLLENPAGTPADPARALIRKLQFLRKLRTEADELQAELEDAE